jgi:hypothetical protein
MDYYRSAAGSQSTLGQRAAAEYVRMDLPQNPGSYVVAGGQFDARGQLLVVVQNRAPVALRNIQVTPVLVDGQGRVIRQGARLGLDVLLKPGEQTAARSGIAVSQQELPYLRFRIDAAQVAD